MIFPNQLKNQNFRFVRLGKWNLWRNSKTQEVKNFTADQFLKIDKEVWKPLGKQPFDKKWQEGKTLEEIKTHKDNFGVIGGYGNLRIRDIDDPKLSKQLIKENKFDTFTIKTGSGGLHLYYLSDYKENKVLNNGELRSENYQVVAPNCIHPSGNKYSIIADLPIKEISSEELKAKWITPFLRETDQQDLIKVNDKTESDESRSAREFGELCKLIKQGLQKDKIFEKMMAFTKWSNPHHPSYRDHSYNKALKKIQGETNLTAPTEKPKPLELRDFNYFKNLKKDKTQLIDGVLGREHLSMWFSPPKSLKSILSVYAGSCLATGKDFLGQKTKKCNVLLIDLENNELVKQERIMAIKEGLNVRGFKGISYLSRK